MIKKFADVYLSIETTTRLVSPIYIPNWEERTIWKMFLSHGQILYSATTRGTRLKQPIQPQHNGSYTGGLLQKRSKCLLLSQDITLTRSINNVSLGCVSPRVFSGGSTGAGLLVGGHWFRFPIIYFNLSI